jgi:hypothetical protein
MKPNPVGSDSERLTPMSATELSPAYHKGMLKGHLEKAKVEGGGLITVHFLREASRTGLTRRYRCFVVYTVQGQPWPIEITFAIGRALPYKMERLDGIYWLKSGHATPDDITRAIEVATGYICDAHQL